jgi:hypothetical protein
LPNFFFLLILISSIFILTFLLFYFILIYFCLFSLDWIRLQISVGGHMIFLSSFFWLLILMFFSYFFNIIRLLIFFFSKKQLKCNLFFSLPLGLIKNILKQSEIWVDVLWQIGKYEISFFHIFSRVNWLPIKIFLIFLIVRFGQDL